MCSFYEKYGQYFIFYVILNLPCCEGLGRSFLFSELFLGNVLPAIPVVLTKHQFKFSRKQIPKLVDFKYLYNLTMKINIFNFSSLGTNIIFPTLFDFTDFRERFLNTIMKMWIRCRSLMLKSTVP